MKKKGKAKGKSMIKRYTEAEGKKNLKVAGMKTGVELVAAIAGSGLGALFGMGAIPAGVVTILAGEYFGDETNLSKAGGGAMIGYGIAKATDFDNARKANTVNGVSFGSIKEGAKGRLTDFKDNFLKAFYLDKLIKKKEEPNQGEERDGTVGSIDLSDLEVFENLNRQQAIKFEADRIREEEDLMIDEPEMEVFRNFEMDEEVDEQLTVQEIDSLDGHIMMEDHREFDFNTI